MDAGISGIQVNRDADHPGTRHRPVGTDLEPAEGPAWEGGLLRPAAPASVSCSAVDLKGPRGRLSSGCPLLQAAGPRPTVRLNLSSTTSSRHLSELRTGEALTQPRLHGRLHAAPELLRLQIDNNFTTVTEKHVQGHQRAAACLAEAAR